MESKKKGYHISSSGPYFHSRRAHSYERSLIFNDLRSNDCDIYIIEHALDTTKALFRSIAKGLSFPEYFGENWNAFDECINDLSWLRAKSIIVVLEKADDLSKLPPDDLKIFIDVIADAIDNWKREDAPLHFVFVCSNATLLQIKRLIGLEIEEWD